MVFPCHSRQERDFSYWNHKNKSNFYSKKLNELFRKALKLISIHPSIGIPTTIENIRIKIIRDYLLIYEERENEIIVLTIWDSRQHPDNLKI